MKMGFKSKIAGGLTAAAIALSSLLLWEGNEKKVYLDVAGIPTVGMGVVVKNMKVGTILSDAQIEEINRKAFDKVAGYVLPRLPENAPETFKAAHISLAYNIGNAGWLNSTARKKALAGDFKGSCQAFKAWNKITVKGKKVVSKGLVNRRAKEVALCESEL